MKIDLGQINSVLCINAHFDADRVVYNYIILKKSKGEISLGKQGKKITDINTIVKEVGIRLPVLIHFTGKGILNRKLKKEENYRHTILLNAQQNEFYFTDYFEGNSIYSSIIRRDAVNAIHTTFTNSKLLVIGISSGPFIIMPLVSFLNQSEFVIDEYKLKTEKTLLISFEKETECFGKVKIGNDQVESDLLGALALGANYFNPNETMLLSNEEAEFMANMLEAKQRNIFYRFGMGMMLFFLLMLSSNYLLLGSLNHRIESNMELLVQFEDQLSELSLLQEEQSRKENLLRTSGLLNNQFLSFYAAELSHSVPQEIHFETIEIRPLLSEIKKKQKIEFQDRLLKISGKSPSSELLSNWIEDLKNESWISKVDIMEYTYLKNEGNFRIEILVQ